MFAAVFFCAERLRALFAAVEKVTLSEDFGAAKRYFSSNTVGRTIGKPSSLSDMFEITSFAS